MLLPSLLIQRCAAILVLACTIQSAVAQHRSKGSSETTRARLGGQSTRITRTTGTVATMTIASSSATATVAGGSAALNASVMNCFLKLPNNVLSAEGLATPFELQAPCSQSVFLQQSFAEAAIIDPATGDISIYHPLVINEGMTPQAAPVVPSLPANAAVALWFGFNGVVLELLDQNGEDTNESPTLKGIDCVNGLPGTQGDVFGQVSWCNTGPFWSAVSTAIQNNQLDVPSLGTDSQGNTCLTSRSFEMVDACPSDNVPTQYLLLSDGSTVQDTAANREKFPSAEVINNGSDEALLTLILDPAIGCTPFLGPSLDDPGAMVPSLAMTEIQANQKQQSPIALVPINDPDCLLTASGDVSVPKTDAYRAGVNQPQVSDSSPAVAGQLDFYCTSMMEVQPGFILDFQDEFAKTTTPDAMTGNNLFTFMCARYLMSLQQLGCPSASSQPVAIQTDGNGVATACTIQSKALTAMASTASAATATSAAKDVATSAPRKKAVSATVTAQTASSAAIACTAPTAAATTDSRHEGSGRSGRSGRSGTGSGFTN